MEPIYSYLLSLGHKSKDLHGLKPRDKLKLIASHFGYTKTPHVKKDDYKKILNEFVTSGDHTKERFREVSSSIIQKSINKRDIHKKLDEHDLAISNLPSIKFYKSKEWRDLRYKVLESSGNRCHACGRSPRDGVIIHVDHILPRSIYPEHALNFSNMQILCEDCNLGKSNKYEKDWR